MQLEQIIIRPNRDQLLVQYSDLSGRINTLVANATGNSSVAAVVADATGRLPSNANNPAKAEIQQEISGLEEKLRLLKQSIGVA